MQTGTPVSLLKGIFWPVLSVRAALYTEGLKTDVVQGRPLMEALTTDAAVQVSPAIGEKSGQ